MIKNIQTEMHCSEEKWNRIFRKQCIVGFGHKARQGKDFVAESLRNEFGGIRHNFSDALYQEVCMPHFQPLLSMVKFRNYVGLVIRDLHQHFIGRVVDASLIPEAVDFLKKRNLMQYDCMQEKDAEFLQIWGTNIKRRLYGEDYWVKKWQENIPNSDIVYVTDVRFQNEYETLKKMGGYYIDVIRYNQDGTRFIAQDRDENHPSETDLDNVVPDFVIQAKTKDLIELTYQAKQIMNSIKGGKK